MKNPMLHWKSDFPRLKENLNSSKNLLTGLKM